LRTRWSWDLPSNRFSIRRYNPKGEDCNYSWDFASW
jgi:hypothetical protein